MKRPASAAIHAPPSIFGTTACTVPVVSGSPGPAYRARNSSASAATANVCAPATATTFLLLSIPSASTAASASSALIAEIVPPEGAPSRTSISEGWTTPPPPSPPQAAKKKNEQAIGNQSRAAIDPSRAPQTEEACADGKEKIAL